MSTLAQTVKAFGAAHPLQIAITTVLVVHSSTKKKLTPDGIVAAVVTAVIHMLHPWGVFFYLLVTFFLAGTIATKVRLGLILCSVNCFLSGRKGASELDVDFHLDKYLRSGVWMWLFFGLYLNSSIQSRKIAV